MKFLTIDYIKQHSRIDNDAEDVLLEVYGEAAEETVLNLLNRSYEDIVETYGEMPKALMQAALMLVDMSYTYRAPVSPTTVNNVPYAFDVLVKPYIKLASNNEYNQGYDCKNL